MKRNFWTCAAAAMALIPVLACLLSAGGCGRPASAANELRESGNTTDAQALDGKVDDTGDTMTGCLVLDMSSQNQAWAIPAVYRNLSGGFYYTFDVRPGSYGIIRFQENGVTRQYFRFDGVNDRLEIYNAANNGCNFYIDTYGETMAGFGYGSVYTTRPKFEIYSTGGFKAYGKATFGAHTTFVAAPGGGLIGFVCRSSADAGWLLRGARR